MHILITGATGFLGSEVALQLVQSGHSVRCTKRATSKIPQILLPYAQLIEWVDADLMDVFALEDALQGITQVYHSAAWVSLKQADKEPMIRTNVTGTANLVNLCVENGIRLVHVSSIAAIGVAKPGELITENDHLDSSTESDGYALSKLESEMEVWRGIAEGLDAVIVNPSVIIGAGAGFKGSGAMFKLVKDGLSFYTRGASGFVDVKDVAKSMIALMNSEESGERFILSAENYHYQDFFASVANEFGLKAPAKEAKPWMLGLAWRALKLVSLLTGKPATLTKDAAKSSLNESLYSNEKIKQTINITFKPLEQSIAETCQGLINPKNEAEKHIHH